MAAKKMPRKQPKEATADKVDNPWAAHGFKGGKKPFEGAAPPIHTHHGGKYHKKKAGKK
jgi:hypothetical protein